MRISDIQIPERFRKDLGNVDGLAASIDRHGLIQPIAVTPDGVLLCGLRRLKACVQLGWEEIPVRIIQVKGESSIHLERDENVERKPFTPSEAAHIAEAIEELEREKAKERLKEAQSKGGKRSPKEPKQDGENSSQSSETKHEANKASARAAAAVGMSRPTLKKAQEVVAAAKAEPEKYGDLQKRMDATGKVDGAHKELIRRRAMSKPDYGKCPNCAGTKWTEDKEGVSCARCNHPHGEPTGGPDEDRVGTQRSKTVKTVEALMRAFGDLNRLLPKPKDHDEAIGHCKRLWKIAKEWK